MAALVVQTWLNNRVLVNRAAQGHLTLIPRNFITRTDVVNNSQAIIPILKYLRTRPTVEVITENVQAFFRLARPRAKPDVPSFSAACFADIESSTCFRPFLNPSFLCVLSQAPSASTRLGS